MHETEKLSPVSSVEFARSLPAQKLNRHCYSVIKCFKFYFVFRLDVTRLGSGRCKLGSGRVHGFLTETLKVKATLMFV